MSKYKELAERYVATQKALDEAKAECTRLQKEFDHLRMHEIPDAMNEDEIQSINLKGVAGLERCRLGITDDVRASVPADKREEAYEWLMEHGHGDLVVDYCHPSTLKAWVKEYLKSQMKSELPNTPELPEHLFVWETFQRASVTRR